MDSEGYISMYKLLSKHNSKWPIQFKMADKHQNGRQNIQMVDMSKIMLKFKLIASCLSNG